MKTLARITVFLRHLTAHDPSYHKAKRAAEFALNTAIEANLLSSSDIVDIAVMLEPDIHRMSLSELAADVRDSISATLVGLVGGGPVTYDLFHNILKHMPKEH
jgi:hypothetical protein